MLKTLRIPVLATLLGVMALAAGPAAADALPRYQTARHVVSGYGSHRFTVTFPGGRAARVYVRGDRSSDLDLYVYDENGNLIGKDLGFTDSCVVRWTPRWTGPFVVVVKNRGRRANLYRVWTN
ncbi:MAG: hypothetical protein ACE5JG_11995 [Planctomycetota bacterium]